ncbi:hypothetical protein DFS34DRAFT_632536, partial [Phlyctochytrium arcticum]
MDSSSWELLYDVLNSNPHGLPVFIFTQPIATYSYKSVVYNKVQRHNDISFGMHTLKGMTLTDTRDMIMISWPGAFIKGVHPDLVEQIFSLSKGRPLFIEAHVVDFHESGQYRINQDRILTTQEDKLILGRQSSRVGRSLITARYSGLDPTFQLFLKIASALGERFQVDDVVTCFKDTPVSTKAFRVHQKQVPFNIDQNDKYGFLKRCESSDTQEGLTYQFKSNTVRNCIYDMMDDTQRQQLHLNIALNYENRITKDKDLRPVLLFSLL